MKNKKELEMSNETIEEMVPKQLEEISFDVVTGVSLSKEGNKRFARRKAVFVHQLEAYFYVTPRNKGGGK